MKWMARVAAVAAIGAAGAAQAAPAWKAGDEAKARSGAKRVMMVALRAAAQPRGSLGTCGVEAIVVGTERGRGPVPGAPLGFLVPCAGATQGDNAGKRSIATAALAPGSLWRLYLAGDGEPRDLEALAGRVAPIQPAAEEADRRQVWRLLHAGSGDSLLVDTDDVAAEGDRRTAWVKRNLERRERRIVQVLTRVEFDCAARTQTLHAWYARTGSATVDSEGVVPEGARRAVPVLKGTDAGLAMRVICPRPPSR